MLMFLYCALLWLLWGSVLVSIHGRKSSYHLSTVKNKLFWVPNNAGLFSHFLQMKIMARAAENLNRALVIAPTKSPHYGNRTIQMCAMFHMPPSVTCSTVPKEVKCEIDFSKISHDTAEELCYSGHISFNAAEKARNSILAAVNLPPLLHLTPSYRSIAAQFELALRTLANHPKGITVVHWRRGDQLQGRCIRKVDESVNCGSAAELAGKIKVISPYRTVYIATNENPASPEMDVLRREGFYAYRDVMSVIENNGADWTVFDTLLAEVWLMMQADLFLAWGISEINDVVEYDRMFAGKEYCVEQVPPQNEEQVTWCSQLAVRKSLENRLQTSD